MTSYQSATDDQDVASLHRWFDGYLSTFAACVRGEQEVDALLQWYGVPLTFCTDDGLTTLTAPDDVVNAMRPQIEALGAQRYDHSEVLRAEVTPLNKSTFLYRGSFTRIRRDGSEIAQLGAAYVITEGPAGRRIHTLISTPV